MRRALRGWVGHVGAGLVFAVAAAISMRGWFVYDRIPGGDFAGYAAVVQYVRDMLLEHGRVPAWAPFFGGSSWLMSPWKEYLAFPLALWLEPLLAVKVLFPLTRVAAALGMYAIFVRGFGSPTAGLLAGYAFAFGNLANHQEQHLDITVSYALFAWLTFATLELLRRSSWRAAVAVGVLAGSLFSNNYLQGTVYSILVLLLLALRPWERGAADENDRLRGVVAPLALAGVVATIFGASQLLWIVADLDHHALIPPEQVERGRALHIIRTPFFLLNRDNWLGAWITAHGPPGVEKRAEIYWATHYLGGVLMAACAAGWFAARRRRVLRRWFQSFGLLFAIQYSFASGARTPLWQIRQSFDWSASTETTLQWLLGGLSVAAAAAALVLAVRRRAGPRMEACLAIALLGLIASQPLFELASSVVTPLRTLRSPGHFFDLAPLSAAAVFGAAWVAVEHRIPSTRVRHLLAGALALALVADYWPSTRVYERGAPAAPDRVLQAEIAGLEGESRSLRIGIGLYCGIRCSLIAGTSRAGLAWSWLGWQASPYWRTFVTAANPVVENQGSDASDALTRIGRIRYFLAHSTATLRPPWEEHARSREFVLWQRPDVLPMAYGLRTYVVYLGGDDTLMRWSLIDDALQRNIVTIAEPGGLADTAAALLDGAALIRARKEIFDDAPRAQLERYRAALRAGERPRQSGAWQAPIRPRLDVHYERPAPERISLEVDAGSEPAVVFVSESHHPWWTARVDGEPVDVLRAQNVFMAVRVGPGRHRIELAFTLPAAVAAADAATRVGWLALVAGLPVYAVTVWRRKRNGP